MRQTEITRRLASISDTDAIPLAVQFIREGASARAVARETGLTLKQVNALFEHEYKFNRYL